MESVASPVKLNRFGSGCEAVGAPLESTELVELKLTTFVVSTTATRIILLAGDFESTRLGVIRLDVRANDDEKLGCTSTTACEVTSLARPNSFGRESFWLVRSGLASPAVGSNAIEFCATTEVAIIEPANTIARVSFRLKDDRRASCPECF